MDPHKMKLLRVPDKSVNFLEFFFYKRNSNIPDYPSGSTDKYNKLCQRIHQVSIVLTLASQNLKKAVWITGEE